METALKGQKHTYIEAVAVKSKCFKTSGSYTQCVYLSKCRPGRSCYPPHRGWSRPGGGPAGSTSSYLRVEILNTVKKECFFPALWFKLEGFKQP